MSGHRNPACLDLYELAQAIRSGNVSSVEATSDCIRRIDQHDGRVNAFISLEREAVLEAAAAADSDLARGVVRGPLHGVPLAHKDMFYRQGRVSTCGSAIRRNYVPDVTATVLERLAASGALYLGSLNMSEFAAGPTGHNQHFGDCRNPWNTEHISGGSSSGSGASVAARFVPGALGSDTGGSVRLPAAICGVVGLKPTYGLVSRHGCMPRAWSLDCVGPLTRTVRDCALMTEVIAGEDACDPSTVPGRPRGYLDGLEAGVSKRRVGVPTSYFYAAVDDEVRAILDRSLAVLREAGAEIVEVALPDMAPLFAMGDSISKCEAATIHEEWMRTRPEAYGAHTFTRVEAGFHVPAIRYIKALTLRRRYLEEFLDTVFSRVDLLHAPAIGMPVPTIAETEHTDTAAVPALVASLTRLTRPMNYLGLPALSVPCGFTASGLPVAFQLIAVPFAEADLFAAGDAYQRATNWHQRTPTLVHQVG